MHIKFERTMHSLSKKGFCCFISQRIALLKQVFLVLDPHRAHLDILANASGSISPFYHWSVWLPLGWDLAPGQCIFNRVLHSHPACCHCLGGLHNYRPKADPQKHPEHILRKRHRHGHTLLGVDWDDLFSYIDCTLLMLLLLRCCRTLKDVLCFCPAV